jgi:predicted phage tail protein
MIRLSLTSADTGSGLRNVEISVRDQAEGVWRAWVNTTQPSVGFFGTPGHTYEFRSRAVDAVGNREFIHAFPDASATTPINATFQRLTLPVLMR